MATKKKTAKPASKSKKPAPAKAKSAKKPSPAKKPAKVAAKKPNKKIVAKKPVKPAPKKVVAKAPAKPAKPIVKGKAPVVPSKTAAVKTAVKNPPAAPAKSAVKVNPATKPAQPAIKSPFKSPNASGLPKATAKNARDIKVIPPKPVAIPKISTKSSRKYQPDFTKSVLDQPKNDPGASIVRYSDSELAEFRELIHRKLEAAKKELSYLQGLITRKDEMGGDESESRYLTMEDGSLSMEREQLSQMASRQITYIDHLEKSLMRIENKTYGICRVTGKLIDKARLRAVPHATLSIEAKMGIVK